MDVIYTLDNTYPLVSLDFLLRSETYLKECPHNRALQIGLPLCLASQKDVVRLRASLQTGLYKVLQVDQDVTTSYIFSPLCVLCGA